MKVVYVAGPYKADTREEVEKNIRTAEAAAIQLWNNGLGVFCPHTNSRDFDTQTTALPQDFLEFDLRVLPVCDLMLVLPGWRRSAGSKVEIRRAEQLGIPIYYSIKHLLNSKK